MRTIPLIIAAACLAAVLAPAPPARAGDVELANPVSKNGCSISFPKNWRLDSVAGASAFVFATAPAADSKDGQKYAAQINISRVPVAKDSKDDLLTIAKSSQVAMAKGSQNYKVVETPHEGVINDAKCVAFGGTYTQSGVNLRNRQFLVAAPGRLYIITFTALESAWENRLPAGDASIATFKVLLEKP